MPLWVDLFFFIAGFYELKIIWGYCPSFQMAARGSSQFASKSAVQLLDMLAVGPSYIDMIYSHFFWSCLRSCKSMGAWLSLKIYRSQGEWRCCSDSTEAELQRNRERFVLEVFSAGRSWLPGWPDLWLGSWSKVAGPSDPGCRTLGYTRFWGQTWLSNWQLGTESQQSWFFLLLASLSWSLFGGLLVLQTTMVAYFANLVFFLDMAFWGNFCKLVVLWFWKLLALCFFTP